MDPYRIPNVVVVGEVCSVPVGIGTSLHHQNGIMTFFKMKDENLVRKSLLSIFYSIALYLFIIFKFYIQDGPQYGRRGEFNNGNNGMNHGLGHQSQMSMPPVSLSNTNTAASDVRNPGGYLPQMQRQGQNQNQIQSQSQWGNGPTSTLQYTQSMNQHQRGYRESHSVKIVLTIYAKIKI